MPQFQGDQVSYKSMNKSIVLICTTTENLNAATRDSIINLPVAAHQEEDFKNLFAYVSSGG